MYCPWDPIGIVFSGVMVSKPVCWGGSGKQSLQALTQEGQYSDSVYNLRGVQVTVNKSSQASIVSLS